MTTKEKIKRDRVLVAEGAKFVLRRDGKFDICVPSPDDAEDDDMIFTIDRSEVLELKKWLNEVLT